MTITPDLDARLTLYHAAQRKAVGFLLAHINEDGSIGDPRRDIGYYRVPWALAVAGEAAAGRRVLEWIRHHMLTAEGELAGDVSPNNGWNQRNNTYAETCLAYGAHLLRQYEMAQQAMRYALRFQNPASGGAYLDKTRCGPDGPQLLFLTCQLGMSALMTGHTQAARVVGGWLQALWDAQPELPHRLYTIWTEAGGLATSVPPGGNRRHYINESQEVYELHYNGGIAAACLAYLYLMTGEEQWLLLARSFQGFSMQSTPRQFETKQVCKSAWGSSLLWMITGDAVYRDWTLRMGDWFVAEQTEDGHWFNTPYLLPNPTLNDNIQITAEFVVHLDHIMSAVGAALAR